MSEHIPVLLQESLAVLHPQPGETVLDVTLGLAGHAKQFVKAVGTQGTLIGLDADTDNLVLAKKALQSVEANVHCIHTNFSELQMLDLPQVDILFADLGVSSLHFDLPERGFSHRFEGPLDLRLDRTTGEPMYTVLQALDEPEIFRILQTYGELDRPHKYARTLYEKREHIMTTTDLKNTIDEVYTFKAKQYYGKVFQALRIYINKELEALEALLNFATTRRIAKIGIISFHSLEDRLVKQHFRAACKDSKDEYTGQNLDDALYKDLTRKPIVPTQSEQDLNPRSRSAKLRAIQLKTYARS